MKTIIRTGIIEINSTKVDSYQWVSAKIQRLEVDDTGKVLSESPRVGRMTRRVDLVATEFVSVVDPVTGKTIKISVGGIGTAIKAMMAKWMLEDYNVHYDPTLDAVVLNGTSL